MTLKGKNKFLRNIIVCLVTVVFIAGIAGVVYSQNNASVKISFKNDTWDISKNQGFDKEWFINANENEVKFIVDLSDYKIESTSSEGDVGEDIATPVEPEQPENSGTENSENPPVDGSEEVNETPDNVEVVSDGEDANGDVWNSEENQIPDNNTSNDSIQITYPNLVDVMDIKLTSDNTTIEFGEKEIKYLYDCKYEVTVALNKKDDIDAEMMIDTDYNIYIELVVKENDFEIPVTSNDNPAKNFTIVKDNTNPEIESNLTDGEIINKDKTIEVKFSEKVNYTYNFYICDGITKKTLTDTCGKGEGDVFRYEVNNFEDGDYELKIVATDKAENNKEYEIKFTVNNSAPTITIDGQEIKDFYNKDSELILQLEANDNNGIDIDKSKFKLVKPGQKPQDYQFEKFDGIDNNGKIATKKIDLSYEGEYLLTVDAYDNKEVGGTIFIDKKIIVDRSPATIDINVKNNDFYNTDKIVQITIKDDNLGNDIIEVLFNGIKLENSWNKTQIEGGVVYDSNFSEPGNYTIVVNSTDAANNKSEKTEVSFTIDKKAPTIEITDVNNNKFEGNVQLDVDEILLNILTNDDNQDVNNIIIEGIFNGESILKNEAGELVKNIIYNDDNLTVKGNERFKQIKLTEEGKYTIKISSTDKAGNQNSKTIEFVIDRTAPEVNISIEKREKSIDPKNENGFYKNGVNVIVDVIEENYNDYITEIYFNKDNSEENVKLDFIDSIDRERSTKNVYLATEHFKEDGIYTFNAIITDKAGHKTSKDISFIIDSKSPIIKITNNGKERINEYLKEDDNKNIEITIEDINLIDKNNLVVKKDGVDYIVDSKKLSFENDKNGIAVMNHNFTQDGNYVISVHSIDAAGNDSYEEVSFIVDNIKPTVEISAIASDKNYTSKDTNLLSGTHINTDEVHLTIKVEDVNLSKQEVLQDNLPTEGKNIISIKCDDNKEIILENELSQESNTIKVDKNLINEGKYTVDVKITDDAGNENSDSFEFTIDRTNPIVEISNYADNGKFLGDDKEVIINVTEINPITDEQDENIIKIKREKFNSKGGMEESKTDSAKINAVDGNRYETNGSGKYVYNVVGKDKAGNPVILMDGDKVISDINLAFVVDKYAPKVTLTIENKVDNSYYNSSMSVNIEVIDDTLKNNTITIIRPDGTEDIVEEFEAKVEEYGQVTKTYNYNFIPDGNNDGNYTVKIVSTDITGKRSTAEYSFTLDKTAPVISFNDFDGLNGSFRQSFDKVTVNIDETNIAHNDTNMIVSYTKTIPDGVTSDPVVFRQRTNTETYTVDNNGNSLFADADAIYTFTVMGKDAATNEAVTKTISFTKDSTKPEVSITGVEEGEHYNTDKTVKILSHDVNHDINTVTVTKDGQNYSVGEFTVNGRDAVINHTFSQEGEYVITLYSKDKAGNDNTTSKTFTIDKTAPVITPVFKGENRVIKPGEYINKIFTPEFKLDEAEDKFDFITLNEGQNVTGAVPMSSTEMVYHYTGQASDKAGNTTPLDITFTVDVTNPEVKVTGIIDGYFNKDIKPEYEITDTNLDNENTIVTLNDKVFESGTKIKDQDYYNLKLLGNDLASNTTSRNIVFAIDKDKPVIKFLEEMSGKYFTEDFIPNFIIEDLTDYTIIAMTLDGVDYEIGDQITEEGKHVLYIEVKDKAENVESISVEFILDKTPPKFIVNGIKDKGIYVEPVSAEITLENPLDKITGITVNGELAQGDVKEENGQKVVKLNFTDINDYEVILKAVDEAGNETEEVINFKIAKKNILTTIYANKTIFYPLVIALAIIAAMVLITVVRKNKKEETQEDSSEE